jgi:hypothetical protein
MDSMEGSETYIAGDEDLHQGIWAVDRSTKSGWQQCHHRTEWDEELHDECGIDHSDFEECVGNERLLDFQVCVWNKRLIDLRMRMDGVEFGICTWLGSRFHSSNYSWGLKICLRVGLCSFIGYIVMTLQCSALYTEPTITLQGRGLIVLWLYS